MSYKAIAEMASNSSLISRVAAAAAKQQKPDPNTWAMQHMWQISASPDWDTTWDYAVDNYNVNQNPDIGARTDVITDSMILAAVQATT